MPLTWNHRLTVINHIFLEAKCNVTNYNHKVKRLNDQQKCNTSCWEKNSWETKSLTYRSWKNYKPVSETLGIQEIAVCPQMEETWNSGEPCQECPAYQNYFKSLSANHPGDHKRTKSNIYTTGGLSLTWRYISHLQKTSWLSSRHL